jgi:TRAP-type mannitol/chloroaromatic compound transport system permease large subunit
MIIIIRLLELATLAFCALGLIMAALFIALIVVRCHLQPDLGPALSPEERAQITTADKLRSLRAGLLPFAIFAGMMVPFINGYTSLVESSVIGVGMTVLGAAVKGRFNAQVFEVATRNTLGITCMFMWVILAALSFGAVFDGLGAVKAVENLFVDQLHMGPWTILILMQLSFLLMGMFLDDTAMLVIVAPLYVPLVASLDFGMPRGDVLIWYGVLYTITCQIAYLTPPFGYNLFLMRAFAPADITMGDIYGSVWPFVLVMVAALAMIMAFPQIALWLPNLIYP